MVMIYQTVFLEKCGHDQGRDNLAWDVLWSICCVISTILVAQVDSHTLSLTDTSTASPKLTIRYIDIRYRDLYEERLFTIMDPCSEHVVMVRYLVVVVPWTQLNDHALIMRSIIKVHVYTSTVNHANNSRLVPINGLWVSFKVWVLEIRHVRALFV